MIYLLDDNKNRQTDFGWDAEKLASYSDIITPIYVFSDMTDELKKKMFSSGSIVLFHESFFDNPLNSLEKNSKKIREKLVEFAGKNTDFILVLFSGSKDERKLKHNIGHIPVSELYTNLELFLTTYGSGTLDIGTLLYGQNSKIEEQLLKKLIALNKEIGNKTIDDSAYSNIVIKTFEQEIDEIFENATYESFFSDDISDEYLDEVVTEWFMENEYQNVFIPLCFGSTLSDYNGLRLASHIRCTATPNRLKNIFIYGFVDLSKLLDNKHFDILKTKNVHLIDYSTKAFENSLTINSVDLSPIEFKAEIRKLQLDPPRDNHKISNEWAIYRWAKTIEAIDEDIEKVIKEVDSKLYFKYLKTIYPISTTSLMDESQLRVTYSGGPKVLFIDDEAEKGWYEIFCDILYEKNKILNFEHIGQELEAKTRAEIIDLCIEKIEKNDIDIVILDYRLHPDDLYENKISDITGLQLLKKIKEVNPGIQVIIFSATNKIWNLQEIQSAGADGFVLKESPENSIDSKFTKQSIIHFKNTFSNSLKRFFLKELFTITAEIENNLNLKINIGDSDFEFFISDLLKQIKIINSAAKKIDLSDSMSLDIVFLNCYNFLEKFKNFYLNEVDYKFVLGLQEEVMNRYIYRNSLVVNEGTFIRINKNDSPSWFHSMAGLFIDYFCICQKDDKMILDLNKIKDKRNNYIHGTKLFFDRNELLMILRLCSRITSKIKE